MTHNVLSGTLNLLHTYRTILYETETVQLYFLDMGNIEIYAKRSLRLVKGVRKFTGSQPIICWC